MFKFYIKKFKNFKLKYNKIGDANLTMNELKDHLKTGKGEEIMKRMTAYSANITGSDSYWFKRRKEKN